MKIVLCHSITALSLAACLLLSITGCTHSRTRQVVAYQVEETPQGEALRFENLGFYGATLPLLDGDIFDADSVILSPAYRGFMKSWIENLGEGEDKDYNYEEPIYLRSVEGYDFGMLPGQMAWLRRDPTTLNSTSDRLKEGLSVRHSRMRVEETFAATPKDQLVRFLRFGVFLYEKRWFEKNNWTYGARVGEGGHVYFYASNPDASDRAAELRIILGLNNEFIILVGASDEGERADMVQAMNRLIRSLSFRK